MTGICLRSVTKSYRNQLVLRGIDLSVPDATVLALVGPSGCGKTTLLRLIAGFERVDDGEILLGSQVVDSRTQSRPPEKRHIGYVPQEGALFPHLTVAGNIGYGLSRRERAGPRGREVLDLVGLAGLADRYPHQLSGGQQQRVALARALAPRPALILLDEPFNSLDLDLRRTMSEDVVALLRELRSTVILVTHDPAEAFAAADRLAVMADGRIMQAGNPAEVYRAPVNAAVARLTGETIFLDGTLSGDRVHTALGPLPLRKREISDCRTIQIMLRPEQIVLTDQDGCEAKVVQRRFRGGHTVLTVAVNGTKLDIRTGDTVKGDTVRLRVRGDSSVFADLPAMKR